MRKAFAGPDAPKTYGQLCTSRLLAQLLTWEIMEGRRNVVSSEAGVSIGLAFMQTTPLPLPSSLDRRRPILTCTLVNTIYIAPCTGPTCKTSNSANILLALQELCSDAKEITVEASGCLGECGNGPNVGISYHAELPRIQTGVKTLDDAVSLIRSFGHTPSTALLEALQSKDRGDRLLNDGDAQGALTAYNSALAVLESRPRLLSRVLCNRSAAFREMKLGQEALRDANEAVEIEPSLAGAWKRKAQAHESLKDTDMAIQGWKMWGKLSGQKKEAERKVRKLKGWPFAVFGG